MSADNIAKLLKQSPYLLIIIAIGYFGKIYLENQINSINTRLNEISKSSLGIKKELRSEERQALIDFRVALERWEHYLFSSMVNFSNSKITSNSINQYYTKESELQLEVKVALAKLGIILQNEDTYLHAYPTIINISNTYNPFISKYLPVLIDLQAELEPAEQRMNRFLKSLDNGSIVSYTLKQAREDKQLNISVQAKMTAIIQQYSDELLVVYPKIVEQLADLKEAMNDQVYRPLTSDRIDQN